MKKERGGQRKGAGNQPLREMERGGWGGGCGGGGVSNPRYQQTKYPNFLSPRKYFGV